MQDPPEEFDLDLVVAGKAHEATDVVSLTLRDPAGAPLPAWQPGAHIDLVLRDGVVRQYSLCGPASDPLAYRVAVLREPAGRGGSLLVHDTVSAGDRLRVRGPRNHFPLVPSARYLFLAGGIGITPLLPMIDAVAAAGHTWRLAYGGRTRASMAFADRLEADYPGHVTLVPQDTDGLLDLGRLFSEAGPETAVYCCGPEGLLSAAESRCGQWPDGALHIERFSPKAGVLDQPAGAFKVHLSESGMTLEVPPGRSILEVAEEAGVFAMFSCREGTCGTCETRVLSGRPDHRDSVLTPAEQDSGKSMMICVSRSKSDTLVLDL